jgi:hypothetical protein
MQFQYDKYAAPGDYRTQQDFAPYVPSSPPIQCPSFTYPPILFNSRREAYSSDMTADEFLASARRTLKREESNGGDVADTIRIQGGAGDMGIHCHSHHLYVCS